MADALNARIGTLPRKGGAEELRMTLIEGSGAPELDVRLFVRLTPQAHAMTPTKFGVVVPLDQIASFASLAALAQGEAVALGLIEGAPT